MAMSTCLTTLDICVCATTPQCICSASAGLLQDGLVSNWLINNMHPGKRVCFKGVDGDFTLQLTDGIPHSRVLLVAGGIGITPMRVLLAERLAQQQAVTLLYFVRSLQEAPFLQEFCEVRPQASL